MVRKERTIMTASIQTKNGFMYVVLFYYVNGEKNLKWISTGLKEKGNKKFPQALSSCPGTFSPLCALSEEMASRS